MRNPKALGRTAILLSACTFLMTAAAADFDGSKPLICAPGEVFDCVAGSACWSGPPRTAGAPSFLLIDFARKTVGGPKLTSTIQHMEKSEEQIVLQGMELKMGWIVVLDRKSGQVSITLADHAGAFVLFGACMVSPGREQK